MCSVFVHYDEGKIGFDRSSKYHDCTNITHVIWCFRRKLQIAKKIIVVPDVMWYRCRRQNCPIYNLSAFRR